MHSFANELKEIRINLGFSIKTMAEDLDIEKSTYQGYESGRRKCPQNIIDAARISLQKDIEFWKTLPERVDSISKKEFPNGIKSEVF